MVKKKCENHWSNWMDPKDKSADKYSKANPDMVLFCLCDL